MLPGGGRWSHPAGQQTALVHAVQKRLLRVTRHATSACQVLVMYRMEASQGTTQMWLGSEPYVWYLTGWALNFTVSLASMCAP